MVRRPIGTNITDVMWDHISSIYDDILVHPFITGLTTGKLERAAFQFYTVQDALYLKDYARSLSLAGLKRPMKRKSSCLMNMPGDAL